MHLVPRLRHRAAEPRASAQFNDVGLMLDGAAAGFGVALMRLKLEPRRLDNGRLVRLSPRQVASPTTTSCAGSRACWSAGNAPPSSTGCALSAGLTEGFDPHLAENAHAGAKILHAHLRPVSESRPQIPGGPGWLVRARLSTSRRQAMVWQQVTTTRSATCSSPRRSAPCQWSCWPRSGSSTSRRTSRRRGGLVAALAIAIFAYSMPAGMAGNAHCWVADRPAADRLDRAEHHLPAPADRAERQLQDPAGFDRRHHAGPAPAAAADRLRLRRLLRGRGRLRHAGGGDRGDPDRPGLLAAGCVRVSAHRQHRAGGLRRAGHAGDHAGQGARLRPDGGVGDDRPPAALLLAAGAVLADLGLRRPQRRCGRSGPPSW